MVATGGNPSSNMQQSQSYRRPSDRATSLWLAPTDAATIGRGHTTPRRGAQWGRRYREVGLRCTTRDLPVGRRKRQAVVRPRDAVGTTTCFRGDRHRCGGQAMNLCNPSAPSLANMLRECCDETDSHVIWVDTAGDVHITTLRNGQSPVTLERSKPTMKLRYPTLCAGCGYTGPAAADDADWLQELLQSLLGRWRQACLETRVAYCDGDSA